jgi:hypothetical protein
VQRGIRLALESGRPIAHVAADVGMHPETLRKSVRQAEAGSGARLDLPSPRSGRRSPSYARRTSSCGAPSRSSSRRRCFLPSSSTQTERSDRVHRGAPRPLRRRADLQDLGRVASAHYHRTRGERSARVIDDERLLEGIRELHAANYYAYGYRRMSKALRRAGGRVGRDRVKRLRSAARTSCCATSAPSGQTPVAGRLHASALLGRRRVLRVCHRRLLAADRRLAVRWAHAHRPRPRRPMDALSRREQGATSSSSITQTPIAIHQLRLQPSPRRPRRAGVDRDRRRRLRSRDGRELRRHLQDRTDLRPRLQDTITARAGDRRVRRLVQRRTPTRIAR